MDNLYESYQKTVKQINEVRLGMITIPNLKNDDGEIFKVNQFLQLNDIYSANSGKSHTIILVSKSDLEKAKDILMKAGYKIS